MKETKMNKVRYCGAREQADMLARGWRMIVQDNARESSDALFERCLGLGFSKIKVYYATTAVRGYHSYFAMVKR